MDKIYTDLGENLTAAFRQYPRPNEPITYGTAGFRAHADTLPSTVYRMGFLAALRSRYHGGKTIGVMITASHNPPADNGLKLIDPQGEMLDSSWEPLATQLASVETEQEFIAQINKIISSQEIDLSTPSHVIYGYDSRASSISLSEVLAKGLAHAHVNHVENTGLLTTPQLHYIVRCENSQNTLDAYGIPTVKGYNAKLSDAYKKICNDLLVHAGPVDIVVDAANGVGAPRFKELVGSLTDLIHATIVNDTYQNAELLNSDCGADFVKVNQRLPRGIVDAQQNKLYCSFDGDADRIVFFYLDSQNQFKLLDGDKIATLAMDFLGDLVAVSQAQIRVGVVQTAYANGSSTEYLTEKLKAPVLCTPTGVKHLHHAAKSFDIGVYFEANGHGTVLFQPAAISCLKSTEAQTPAQQTAIDTLLAFSDLINQTVGDAISDLLMVLAILSMRKWTPGDWNSSYTDLPNRLLKVKVKDRNEFKTTDAERKLVSPPGLQAHIDSSVGKYNQARCFVRASGTENVVRIYVEAQTKAQVDGLALSVVKLLEDYV